MERKVGRNEIYSTNFNQRGLAAPGVLPLGAEPHPDGHAKYTDTCIHRNPASRYGYAPPDRPASRSAGTAFRQRALGSGHESR